MSKPISFGFGKPKTSTTGPPKPSTSISLPSKKPSAVAKPSGLKPRSALADDDDGHDEEQPKHESVTGFSSTGAILSRPVEEKKAIVIENQGNGDWRRRGRGGNNVLPKEERARREGQDVVMVEKDEVSKASGLQFAATVQAEPSTPAILEQQLLPVNGHQEGKLRTVDEEALKALLSDDPNAPRSNAIISVSENKQLRPADELEDFRSDVATRPDVSTLEEYAAMPVEEFGLAMLRGMGKKRRANGEVINVEPEPEKKKEIKKPKHEGFLGIGAKPAPGLEGVELGAWGKADMRKNNKGQGFFTPVMIRDRETGETITEEELELRKQKKPQDGKSGENDDSREKRDQNGEKNGTGRIVDANYKDVVNGFSRRRKDDDSEHDSSRSRRDRDRDRDEDYHSSRSKRPRSRSRERRHRDQDRYDSGSSRKDRDRNYDRDKDRDRYRDRHKTESSRHHDRDSREHRDRR